MDALKHITKKYRIDLRQPSPHYIPCGRFEEVPKLFTELGLKVGAEVGVYRGQYSETLLNGIPDLKMYCIDSWEYYPGYKDYRPEDITDAEREAHERLDHRNAVILKGRSADVAAQIPDESLDFVFIDGNHAYEYVVQDIAIWSKKVRKGGIVYGHDFDDYSQHRRRWAEMNVINAVEGWVKSYKIYPWFVLTGNKNKSWMYVKA